MMHTSAPVNPLAGSHRVPIRLPDDIFTLLATRPLTLFLLTALAQLALALLFLAPGALFCLLLCQSALTSTLFAQGPLTLALLKQLLLALTIRINGPPAVLLAT
jgi:hypothetical protein